MDNIVSIGKRNGKVTVTVSAEYVEAATNLPIYYKAYRPWMLEVEENIRNGKPVALEDIGYMADLALKMHCTARQFELKRALADICKSANKRAA